MKKRSQAHRKDHWTRAVSPPDGARFVPVAAAPGVGWGVLRRNVGEIHNDLREFVWEKLHPVKPLRPGSFSDQWAPTATVDVLLPNTAPAELTDPRRLAERYEAEAFPGIKDLAICVTIQIPQPERVLAEWFRVRAFAYQAFCVDRQVAVIAALHVPARSGVKRAAHVHLIAPARELGNEFGAFLRPFASDAGAAVLAKEWAAWD